VLLLLASSATAQVPGMSVEPCDICVGRDQVDAAQSIGPIPCENWYNMSSYTFDETENCLLNRAAGAKFCSCGDAVTWNTCYLCGDATSNQQADFSKYIPDSPGGSLTCGDMLEMPAVDNLDTCSLLQEKYAFWCGCPNANANVPCPFCPEGAPPNLDVEYPFTNGGMSCSELHDFYQVQTASSCETLRGSDFQYFLIDMPAHCECPGRSAPMLCQGSYCPEGQGIPTENLTNAIGQNLGVTCADTDFLMDFITKPEDCDFLYSTANLCCAEVSQVATEVDSENAGSGSGTVFESTGGNQQSSASRMSAVAWTASILGFFVW
jgi:hypothetical protein